MYITFLFEEAPKEPSPPPPLPEFWCAMPQQDELLLGDEAREFAVKGWLPMGPTLEPESSVEVITDEAICRLAAQAFYDNTQRNNDGDDDPLGRVLVIKLGNVYLVENLKPRHGYRQGFWHVLIFDDKWNSFGGYGDGA